MYDRRFFQTKLGQAALASTAAMAIFAALSSQIVLQTPPPVAMQFAQVELA